MKNIVCFKTPLPLWCVKRTSRLEDEDAEAVGLELLGLFEKGGLFPRELRVDGVLREPEAELEQHRAGVRAQRHSAHVGLRAHKTREREKEDEKVALQVLCLK